MDTQDGKDNKAEELRKIMIPMIRKVLPTLVAADIIGVQPMQAFPTKMPLEVGTTHYEDDSVEFYWVRSQTSTLKAFRVLYGGGQQNAVLEEYEWVQSTFGPETPERWICMENTFYFKHEKDRTLFILKYSA